MDINVNNNIKSRRDFIKYIISGLSFFAISWWLFVSGRERKLDQVDKTVIIGQQIPKGITFLKGVVIIHEDSKPKAFLAKCTHLGCSIRKSEGKELICQCHGSRFNANGVVTKGPAMKSLLELPIILNSNTGMFQINVEG